MPPRKAVALISGGLDSMLAARVVLEQGVHVEGLNIFTGFCVEGHTHAIRNVKRAAPRRNHALWVAEQLGIKLHIVEVIEEYKKVLLAPRHGYGANLNPCLDCKSFMVGKARAWMNEQGFDFIITGEVIGQRPKSQTRKKLPLISRESGAFDLLLRPLSGRSRGRQIELAAHYGIEDYAQPAGGCCFLTDAAYSSRLRDLWRSRGSRDYDFDDIMLLKVGRHLRPRPHFKMIVARDAGEDRFLRGYRRSFPHLQALSHVGPLALVQGEPDREDLELAARTPPALVRAATSRW